jgi:hypothetical protein
VWRLWKGRKGGGFMRNRQGINLEGDVVLIYYQDEPSVYARIEAIEPDVKKDWYRVTLLMLTIPAQSATWILREEYFNGTPFTMGGEPLRIEGVERAHPSSEPSSESDALGVDPSREPSSKVIPLHRKRT